MNSPHMTKGSLVEFTTSDKLKLHGFLTGNLKAKTCVLFVHGMGGNFYRSEVLQAIRQQAVHDGVAFFSINSRGADRLSKINHVNGKRVPAGTCVEKFEECVKDISSAIAAMSKCGFRNIVLCGHSTGCQKVTLYQYKTKNTFVKGLVLLAPCDDYNLHKATLGTQWQVAVRRSNKLVRQGKSNEVQNNLPYGLSAQRFLSVASLKRVESRLFNYKSNLKEFSSITCPILAVFGSREEHATKPVKTYLDILAKKTRSKKFVSFIVKGANHGFQGHLSELAKKVLDWSKTVS